MAMAPSGAGSNPRPVLQQRDGLAVAPAWPGPRSNTLGGQGALTETAAWRREGPRRGNSLPRRGGHVPLA